MDKYLMDPERNHIAVLEKNRTLISFLIVILVLALWYFSTLEQTSQNALLFPSLKKMFLSVNNNFDSYFYSFLNTWYRVLAGLIIGSSIGVILGLLMTWSLTIELLFDPFIELIRPIPPIALTPFFILWFGLGDAGQLLLVGLGCFMVIVITTVVSVRNVDPIFKRAALSLGANDLQLYRKVYIPAIMPSISSGLRVASATGFGLTVAAEYLGAQGGLGYMMRNARITLNTEVILAAALLLGVQSLLTDQFIRYCFSKITQWKPE